MQHVISHCSKFVLSIIKIFCRVYALQSRNKKSNSNTRRGDNSKSKKSWSCHFCMWHVVWSCSSLLLSFIKIFRRVYDLHKLNLNHCIIVRNTLPCPIVQFCKVPSKYFGYSSYIVHEKYSINKTKGDNSKSKKVRVVILVRDTSSGPVLHFYQVS